jgi:hypothetical protein
MNAVVVESPSWSRRKWSAYVGLIFLLHVGLIFWLARGEAQRGIKTEAAPAILLLSSSIADVSGSMDPTLLPLPNQHGASGHAWLKAPAMEYNPNPWAGPSGMLVLHTDKLGEGLVSLVRTNLSQPLEVAGRPEPGLERTSYYVQPELASTQSLFHVEGEIAARALQNSFKLRSWPMADAVLTNSEVQIVVDETGRVFAPPILVSKSGSDEADASALELARSARFQSVRPRGPRHAKDAPQPLAWGKLVFEWQTVPILPTNTPGMGRRP